MSSTAEAAITSGKTQVLGSITVIDTPLVTRAMDYQIKDESYLLWRFT